MTDLVNLLNEFTHEEVRQDVNGVFNEFLKWYPKYNEFAQGRTNFQIEKFIAMDDGTPASSYVNTLYQTRVMRGELLREVKEAIELLRAFEMDWGSVPEGERNEPIVIREANGQFRYRWYDLDKVWHDYRILDIKMSIKDKLQQLNTFDAILKKFEENHGGEFTKQDYDDEAPKYWENRFLRQSIDAIMGNASGIDTGTLKSIRQATSESIVGNRNTEISQSSILRQFIDGNLSPEQFVRMGNESIDAAYQNLSLASKEHQPALTKPDHDPKPQSTNKGGTYAPNPDTLASWGITIK